MLPRSGITARPSLRWACRSPSGHTGRGDFRGGVSRGLLRSISMDRQGMIAGMLFTAALWWATFRLLRRAGAGDVQWAVYGIALPSSACTRFYSRSIASETFSQATLALLAMWTMTRAWGVCSTRSSSAVSLRC